MNPQLKRIVGIVLLVVAIVSLIISASGLISLWAFKQNAVTAVSNAASLLTDALITTDKALVAADEVLQGVQGSSATLLSTTATIAAALRDGQPHLKLG